MIFHNISEQWALLDLFLSMLVFLEGYERLAQARGSGNAHTESCDMFGDDGDAPIPSSNLPSGSISGTQLNPDTTAAESKSEL